MTTETDDPVQNAGVIAVACLSPKCSQPFTPRRKDQRYCSKPCAKAATRNAARGKREVENARRDHEHYNRAEWLSYDVNRMPESLRQRFLHALVVSVMSGNAKLRNILTDPRLLGAGCAEPIGKLSIDRRCHSALNIAKLVHRYCRQRWCKSLHQLWTAGHKVTDGIPVAPTPPPEPPLPTYLKRDSGAFLTALRAMRPASMLLVKAA